MDLSSRQALAEKAKMLMDPRSANCRKDTTLKIKELAQEESLGKQRQKVALRRRKEPYKTLNRTNNIVQELSEKWSKGKKETL